jgi:hypothetical protein
VYHFERFIPVFNTQLLPREASTPNTTTSTFSQYRVDGSDHIGKTDGFNVSNASVTDDDHVITDNGYLYHISQVLDPLETIYTELKNNADYSIFFELFNSYGEYQEDPN